MKLSGTLLAVSLVVLMLLTLAASGARWFGQQRLSGTFPLPDANGCWLDICPLTTSPDALVATFNAHPRITGAEYQPTSGISVSFNYITLTTRLQPVHLYWSTSSYNLVADLNRSTGSLTQLGNVIAVLGPPDLVQFSSEMIHLNYPARGLQVIIRTTGYRLTPSDPVVSFFVADPRFMSETETVYYPPAEPWHGFGLYSY